MPAQRRWHAYRLQQVQSWKWKHGTGWNLIEVGSGRAKLFSSDQNCHQYNLRDGLHHRNHRQDQPMKSTPTVTSSSPAAIKDSVGNAVFVVSSVETKQCRPEENYTKLLCIASSQNILCQWAYRICTWKTTPYCYNWLDRTETLTLIAKLLQPGV